MDEKVNILAVDTGYGSIKCAMYDETGGIRFLKFLSAVSKIDDASEVDDDVMFKLGTDTYVLGETALRVGRENILPLETYEDMKTITPVWISYLMKKFNPEHIIIGLSLAYMDKADDLLEYLYNTLMIDPSTNYFICLPQGLACKQCYNEFGLNPRETNRKGYSRLMSSYLIADLGMNTADFSNVANQVASSKSSIGLQGTGVIYIAHCIVDYVFKTYGVKITVKEAQTIMESDGIWTRRGRKYDLSQQLDEFSVMYIGKILDLIEEKYQSVLDNIEGVLVCGGGAYLFKKYINDPRVITEIEKHFPVSFIQLPEVDAEFFNAVSYLKIGDKLLKEGTV